MSGNIHFGLVVLSLVGLALAANPQQRLGPGNTNCNGPVGFSTVGIGNISDGLIKFRTILFNQGVVQGSRGEVTFVCPGLYQISFSAYSGDTPNTSVVLHMKTTRNTSWVAMVGTGGGQSWGGFNQILVALNQGDKAGVWLSSGMLTYAMDSRLPASTFSAFRVASL